MRIHLHLGPITLSSGGHRRRPSRAQRQAARDAKQARAAATWQRWGRNAEAVSDMLAAEPGVKRRHSATRNVARAAAASYFRRR